MCRILTFNPCLLFVCTLKRVNNSPQYFVCKMIYLQAAPRLQWTLGSNPGLLKEMCANSSATSCRNHECKFNNLKAKLGNQCSPNYCITFSLSLPTWLTSVCTVHCTLYKCLCTVLWRTYWPSHSYTLHAACKACRQREGFIACRHLRNCEH